MGKKLFSTLVFMGLAELVFAADLLERQDPSRNAVNRESARAYSFPLARVEDALVAGVPETPYVQSLNGVWKLLVRNAESASKGDRTRRLRRFPLDDDRRAVVRGAPWIRRAALHRAWLPPSHHAADHR